MGIFIISLIVILLDQIIKYIVVSNMMFTETINVIKNFFRITYLQNTGGAWSILSGSTFFLVVLAAIMLIFIIYMIKKEKKITTIKIFTYGILIGGIVGNMIDRIRFDYVIDYLDFNFLSYNFPVFNLADIAIVVGSIILIITLIKEDKDGHSSR